MHGFASEGLIAPQGHVEHFYDG